MRLRYRMAHSLWRLKKSSRSARAKRPSFLRSALPMRSNERSSLITVVSDWLLVLGRTDHPRLSPVTNYQSQITAPWASAHGVGHPLSAPAFRVDRVAQNDAFAVPGVQHAPRTRTPEVGFIAIAYFLARPNAHAGLLRLLAVLLRRHRRSNNHCNQGSCLP